MEYQLIDQKYEESLIEVCGEKLTYRPVINPSGLGELDKTKLNQAARRVNQQIDEYCALIAEVSYVKPNDKDKLFQRLLDVRKNIIESKERPRRKRERVLSEANFEVHRVHAEIAYEQLEMKEKEKQELARQRSELSTSAKVLIMVYGVGIVALIVVGWVTDFGMVEMPVVGIPLSVLLWSVIGSLAAILYRFYKNQIRKSEQIEIEERWLLARPIIGIIMGMVTYLIIIAGLFVFGSATPEGNPSTKPQFLWVAAFLAGFSDRFWEGFIDKLLANNP